MSFRKWEAIARCYDPLKAGSIDGTDTVPHDHAVARAMAAEYKPNNLVVGDPKATIFVGRLNPKTDEDTLKTIFSRSGEIKRLRLVRDVVTGCSRRYAFIEYFDKYDAIRAEREYNRTVIDDQEILVDMEYERLIPGWIPRRLGGGLSGKKESGQLRFGGKDRPFRKPLILCGLSQKQEFPYKADRRYDPHRKIRHRSRDEYPNRSHKKSHFLDRDYRDKFD